MLVGAAAALPRVGALVEGPALYPFLSGRDNLARCAAANATGDPRTACLGRIGQVLDRVGLLAAAGKRYRALFAGHEEQRLAIAGQPAAAPGAAGAGRADQRPRPAGHPRGARPDRADRGGRHHRVPVLAPAGRGGAGVLARRRDAGWVAGLPGPAGRAAPHRGGPDPGGNRRPRGGRRGAEAVGCGAGSPPGTSDRAAGPATSRNRSARRLVAAGVGVRGFGLAVPTLEELFVTLYRGRVRDRRRMSR